MRLCIVGILAALLVGCADDTGGTPDAEVGCQITGQPTLEIGVPDAITFLNFEPLDSGTDQIPLSSNGQTFLAVQLAIRATNLDRQAFIGMTVTYQPDGGGAARTAVKDDSQLERLQCRNDDMLYMVPVVVSSEDLGDDLEIQDKMIDVSVTVRDESGNTASGNASGVLFRI